MCYYEGIFSKKREPLKMNAIIFYSNTNQSKAIADLLYGELLWNKYDLNDRTHAELLSKSVFAGKRESGRIPVGNLCRHAGAGAGETAPLYGSI